MITRADNNNYNAQGDLCHGLCLAFACVQIVQLILDQCGGVAVNELEGVGGEARKIDESGCRAAGETPGNQRYEQA